MRHPYDGLWFRLIGPKATRCLRVRTEQQTTVITESGVEGKPLKVVQTTAKDEWDAQRLVEKLLSPKLLQGYVHVRPVDDVADGEVFFAARPPGAGSGGAFDVDPAGQVAFLASGLGNPSAGVAWVDLQTGASAARPMNNSAGDAQLYGHAAFVAADGQRGFYAVNGRIHEQARGGAERLLADFGTPLYAFNAHCVRADIDQVRARLLVPDQGRVLRVIDLASGKDLCRVAVGTKTTECRSIALSPSGRLFAAYLTSRTVPPHVADTTGDLTNHVFVFRADGGAPVAQVPVAEEVKRVGVAWDDQGVWVQGEYGHTQRLLDLQGGERAALSSKGDPARDGWTYSADGKRFAIGLGPCQVELYDTSSWKRVGAVAVSAGIPRRIVLSPDGRAIFSGGNGFVEGRRLPGLEAKKASKPSRKQ